LKAVLARDGIASDIKYFNLMLASAIRVKRYAAICHLSSGYRGELFFAPHLCDLPVAEYVASKSAPYWEDLYKGFTRSGKELRTVMRSIEEVMLNDIGTFLTEAFESVRWSDYDIVGFSLMFDQTVASLCLANMVKKAFPQIQIVFGGSSCDGEMGGELLRAFDCIDVVVRGEADRTISQLINALRGDGDLRHCPGIVARHGNELVETAPSQLITDMDWLPQPDYSDYILQIAKCSDQKPNLYFESSRGCWWGQKHLCSFCGLNASGLAFRRKSPDRVITELSDLSARYGVTDFAATDNIMDMSYLKTFVPELKRQNDLRPIGNRLSVFYEVKSNIKKTDLNMLKAAGVHSLQPGIESLSDHVLQLMDKGSTGIQQVQFLKWATEAGMRLIYGILYAVPGETAEDYDKMTELVKMIGHLIPPRYISPIVLDRYSPYFNKPATYGIREVRPDGVYEHIYPISVDIAKIAYCFQYDHDDQGDEALAVSRSRCIRACEQWRDQFRAGLLTYEDHGSFVAVLDGRNGTVERTVLDDVESELMRQCDEHHLLAGIVSRCGGYQPTKVIDALARLVARKFVYRDSKDRCIALPIHSALLRAVPDAPHLATTAM